jgi:hypothetical protein
MPPHFRFAPFSALLFSHKAAALAAGAVVLIVLGCMCLNFGSQSSSPDNSDGVLAQEGSISVPANSEVEVYYAIPYSNIPNLTIDDRFSYFIITEQKENHFRVRNKDHFGRNAEWKARGQRVQPPVVIGPQPDGPPSGPPVPVHVGQPK